MICHCFVLNNVDVRLFTLDSDAKLTVVSMSIVEILFLSFLALPEFIRSSFLLIRSASVIRCFSLSLSLDVCGQLVLGQDDPVFRVDRYMLSFSFSVGSVSRSLTLCMSIWVHCFPRSLSVGFYR
jgi:hypothetical protein